ncbi:30S ribosomal protein S5 [Thermoplasmatales archaeon SW_10_69_26]|nr:MAG: 30S ribosomal protein S5 [Thermoplasmatales archaeon SW_10_69_26]
MRKDPRDRDIADWEPRTKLGRLVNEGELSTMPEVLTSGLPLREPEIVDSLMPGIEDDVIDVNMVQRMTDSGRRVRFLVVAVVGNRDGIVGLGQEKGREVGPTIRRAIDQAKLNMLMVRRGSGSWESGPDAPPTSVPFEVIGRAGSVNVTLKPAPQGTGLAAGQVCQQVLELAGIEDIWTFSEGQTRTTVNFAKATFQALRETSKLRVQDHVQQRLSIIEGPAVQPRGQGDSGQQVEAEATGAGAGGGEGG